MSVNTSEPEEDTTESPKGTTQGPARARVTATEKRRHRDAEAARLRAAGHDYDTIADRLKFRDRSGARKAVQRALSDVVQTSTDEARRLAMQRLDGLRRLLVNLVTETGLAPRDTIAAVRALLAVEEREAKLLGLDITAAPVVTGNILDAEIARLTREIGALDALPVRDPWERPDWTPADRVADDVHRDGQHHPGAEVVPINHRNGHGTNGTRAEDEEIRST